MNVMLVAVRERTREIGVRKALGATRRSIVRQFFVETLLVVFVSGGSGPARRLRALRAGEPLAHAARSSRGCCRPGSRGCCAFALLGTVALLSALYPARPRRLDRPHRGAALEAGG